MHTLTHTRAPTPSHTASLELATHSHIHTCTTLRLHCRAMASQRSHMSLAPSVCVCVCVCAFGSLRVCVLVCVYVCVCASTLPVPDELFLHLLIVHDRTCTRVQKRGEPPPPPRPPVSMCRGDCFLITLFPLPLQRPHGKTAISFRALFFAVGQCCLCLPRGFHLCLICSPFTS